MKVPSHLRQSHASSLLGFDPGLPPMQIVEDNPELYVDMWLVQAAIFFTISVIYWLIYVRPTAQNFLRRDSVIAPQVKGRWVTSQFDCFGNCGLLMCSWCCFVPNLVDMWYRAGWLQELCGGPSFVVYMGGVLGFVGCSGCCPCLVPCCFASLRGGTPSAGAALWDGAIPHETRFEIPRADFCMNCLLWCCCSPCMLMQERRQIDEALKAAVVGQPVFGAPPQQGMPPPMAGPAVPSAPPLQEPLAANAH